MQSLRNQLYLLVGAIVLAASANATPTFPAGLSPGDSYRLVFVTSGTITATSANIIDYNNFVTAAANSEPLLAALATTWRVIGSTLIVGALDNMGTSAAGVGIYNLGGQLVAAGTSDLCDGAIDNPINFDEHGSVVSGIAVYTGSEANCTGAGNRQLGSVFGLSASGVPTTTAEWLRANQYVQTDLNNLYAISGELTVGIPEPGSFGLIAAGALLLYRTRLRLRRFL